MQSEYFSQPPTASIAALEPASGREKQADSDLIDHEQNGRGTR